MAFKVIAGDGGICQLKPLPAPSSTSLSSLRAVLAENIARERGLYFFLELSASVVRFRHFFYFPCVRLYFSNKIRRVTTVTATTQTLRKVQILQFNSKRKSNSVLFETTILNLEYSNNANSCHEES